MRKFPMVAVLGAMLVLLAFCSDGSGSSDDADADGEEAVDLSTEEAVEDVGEEEPEEDVEDDAADMVEEEVSSALALALGEVEEIDTSEEGVFDIEIASPEGGEQYALILFATDWVRGATYDFTSSLSGTGGGGRGGADRPEALPPNIEHPLMPHGRAPVDWAAVYNWLGSNPIPKWDELPDDPLPEVDEVREFSITDASAHMIYFHRKFLLNDQPMAMENIYLNEGLAALAQDLTGMAAGNFFVMQAGLAQIETFRAIDILYNMGGYIPDRDGGLRGQAYLFLRYLYDQAGGEEVQGDGTFVDNGGIAWLNAYVDDTERGRELIEAMTGDRAIEETAFDFYTALVLSNRGPDGAPISANPAYNFLPTQVDPLTERTRGANMFENFRGMFQLEGPANGFIDFNDGTIYSTGVQYLFFDAEEPGTLQVHVEIDAAAAARMRVARLQ